MKFISSGPFHRFLLALLALQFLLGPARADDSVILPASELQQLVAPIALYPDPLLALVLPASSFPTELAQANTYVSGGGTDFDSQDWDASIKGLAHYPDVLQMMATNSDWTNQLGAAVLAQQGDVMAAVQSQRGKAKSLGNLVSTPQQTVLSEDNSIQVVPADPQTLYVPDYDPGAVYVQPAPPAGPLVSFGIGFGMGSWIGGGFNWGGGVIFGGGFWGGGVGGGSVGWHWSSHSWSSYHSSSWSRHVWKRDVTHDHWSHPHPSYHPNHAGEHMPGWHGSGTHHPNGRGGENPDHHGGENPNGHGGEKPDHHGGDHGQPALHPNRPIVLRRASRWCIPPPIPITPRAAKAAANTTKAVRASITRATKCPSRTRSISSTTSRGPSGPRRIMRSTSSTTRRIPSTTRTAGVDTRSRMPS